MKFTPLKPKKMTGFTPLNPKGSGLKAGNLTGFTLIEIMVVVVVIGILATMVTVYLNGARVKARDTRRVDDIRQIQIALEMYNNRNNGYPAAITLGNSLSDANGIVYMAKIPSDPKASESGREYAYTANGTSSYTITYALVKGAGTIGAGNWGAVPDNIATPVAASAICQNATGGTITTSGDYTLHTFTASSTFSVDGNCRVMVLAVGGGGGGGGAVSGGFYASGGGGGQVMYTAGLDLTPQAYTVSVGPGGNGQTVNGNNGLTGGNSVFSSLTALGGNGGTNASNHSVGGVSGSSMAGGIGVTAVGGAGGGGAGDSAIGSNGSTTHTGGNGGAGTSNSITGGAVVYGGGGGGGADTTGGTASGGGGAGSNTGTATAGTANTGGGGGASAGTTSANGGSGIVIIKYLTP